MLPTVPFVTDDGLDKTGSFARGLRELSACPGIDTEVEVKGTILLKESDDISDLFAEQIEFLIVTEIGRVRSAKRVLGDLFA
jgi:hypothetical protein